MDNNTCIYHTPELDAAIAHRRDLAAKLLTAASPTIIMMSATAVVGSSEAKSNPAVPIDIDTYLFLVDPYHHAGLMEHHCNCIREIEGIGFIPVLSIVRCEGSNLLHSFLFHFDTSNPTYNSSEVKNCQNELANANAKVKALFLEALKEGNPHIENRRYLNGIPEGKSEVIDPETYVSLLSIPFDSSAILCPSRTWENTPMGWTVVTSCNDHDGKIENHFTFSTLS